MQYLQQSSFFETFINVKISAKSSDFGGFDKRCDNRHRYLDLSISINLLNNMRQS